MAPTKDEYASTDQAKAKTPAQLEAYYRTEHPNVYAAKTADIKAAGDGLVAIFTHNVFPEMKVTWGTHPNHIGHMSYPGCFRCHDGDHATADAKTAIPNDCAACHNLLVVDEAKPKVLSDLGIRP